MSTSESETSISESTPDAPARVEVIGLERLVAALDRVAAVLEADGVKGAIDRVAKAIDWLSDVH